MHRSIAVASLALLSIIVACAPGSRSAGRQGAADPVPRAPKKIVVALQSYPTFLVSLMQTGGVQVGVDGLQNLYNPGLAGLDKQGAQVPVIGEQVPTVENELWKLFPDGRMETTWRIRPGALWHDGTPLTAADAIFTR